MKRILSLLLALIFITGCILTMPSCNFFSNDDNDNDNNSNNNDNIIEAKPIELIKDGVAQYTLVYPDDCAETVNEAMLNLVEAVAELTDVELEYITASEAKKSASEKYILIGATSFAESEEAIESLRGKEDAFAIEKAGNHVVFVSHFDVGVVKAINYYAENLLADNYDAATGTLILEEYWYDGRLYLLSSFEVSDISKYTIVYDSKSPELKAVATQLKSQIEATTGCSINVRQDTSLPETSYEILLGNTNRYLSHKCYKGGTRLMEYKVVVEKGQLQIVCGGAFSANAGVTALIGEFFGNSDSSIPTGTYLVNNLAPESVAHTEGTDVRIMTANVLGQSSDSVSAGFAHSDERIEILAKVLVDYTPDFVGIQEFTTSFHSYVDRYLDIIEETYGIEYSTANMTYNQKAACNFIIYRSDKYRLDYQNAELPNYAPAGSSQYHSILSSAKFTNRKDPLEEIAILTAHWHWEKEAEASYPPKQYTDAVQMTREYKNIQQMYPDARIFCTGDFNSHRFKNLYFNQLLADINGSVASTIAAANGVLIPSFQHYTPKQYIDHVIGAAGTFDVLLHAGTNNCSDKLTDHQPVFADIKFIY